MAHALALLVAEDIETRDGRDTLRNVADGLACSGLPARCNLWVYANLQLEPAEEGRPIELGLDLVEPGGRVHRVFTAKSSGPRRNHPDMPSIWGVKFHVTVRINAPGIHAIRLLTDNELLSSRPILISEEEPGLGI